MLTVATLITAIIIIGLVLRYGRSSIGLAGSLGNFGLAETNALTLANASVYEGP